MGVKGLWDLISPSGRQVRFDTLEGRIVAVDASIWLVQFLKALRNKEGDVFPGAHLIGFFKRLCKLHYYRIRPIIVFDGPAPELKKRTLTERRQRREEEVQVFRKTAQKLVVNFVKRKALEARRKQHIDAPTNAPTLKDVLQGKTLTPPDEQDLPPPPGTARTIQSIDDSDSDALIDVDGELLAKYEVRDDDDEQARMHHEAVARQAERRRQRHAYYDSIPEEYRGFLAERRRLDEIHVPNQGPVLGTNLTTREKFAAFGITIHDVDDNLKFKRPLMGDSPSNEFKAFQTRNSLGEETYIQLPLNAEIDESVFRALPTKMQYKILCQVRDQWLSDLRLHAIAAKDDADIFSNVQIESYIRTIRSNQEIEKVKKKMGEQVKLKHFGTTHDPHEDPLGVETVNTQDEGNFLDFYGSTDIAPAAASESNLPLEEKIKRTLERETEKLKQKEEQAAATAMKHAVAELDNPDKKSRGKHLSLFRKWEMEEDKRKSDDRALLSGTKTKVDWRHCQKPNEDQIVEESDKEMTDGLEFDDQALLDDMLKDVQDPQVMMIEEKKEESSTSTPVKPLKKKIHLTKKSSSSSPPPEEEDEWEEFSDAPPLKKAKEEDLQAELHALLTQHMIKVFKQEGSKTQTVVKPQTANPPTQSANPPPSIKPPPTPVQPPESQTVKVPPSIRPPPTPVQSPESQVVQPPPKTPMRSPSPVPHRQPTHTQRQPARTQDQPALTQDQPAPTQDQPAPTRDQPAQVVRKPGQPAPTRSEPAQTGDQPAKTGDQPAKTGIQPASDEPKSTFRIEEADSGWGALLIDKVAGGPELTSYEVDSPWSPADFPPPPKGPIEVVDVPDQEEFRFDEFIPVVPEVSEPQSSSIPGPSSSSEPTSAPEPARSSRDIPSSSSQDISSSGPGSSEFPPSTSLDEGLEWLNMTSDDFEKNLMKRSRDPDPVTGLVGGEIDLDEMAEALEEEAETLMRNLRKSKARADQVTEEMQEEIRQLCRAFGVPYVQAPSEAEAQAAWLVQAGLAEAVMSDDSDAMVFGASEVFRGFFSDVRGIELYSQREVERCLGLTVAELRILALLLGCDYTLGVKGIGIVNALEVVAAFPTLDDLDAFTEWAHALTQSTGIKPSDSAVVKDYKVRHAGYRAQWEFPPQFPPRAAHEAFVHPKVDMSKEPFTWAPPDVDEILTLMRKRAGLQSHQVLETLTPVINRIREMPPGTFRRQALVDTFLVKPAEDAVAVFRSERQQKTKTTKVIILSFVRS